MYGKYQFCTIINIVKLWGELCKFVYGDFLIILI